MLDSKQLASLRREVLKLAAGSNHLANLRSNIAYRLALVKPDLFSKGIKNMNEDELLKVKEVLTAAHMLLGDLNETQLLILSDAASEVFHQYPEQIELRKQQKAQGLI